MNIKAFVSYRMYYVFLLALIFTFNLHSYSACHDSLSNYWTFDTDTDTETIDRIGSCNSNTGVLSSTALPGVVGVSRFFNGSTSYSFPTYPNYDWEKNLSVAVWCKFTAVDADSMVMVGSHEDSKTSWWIGIDGETDYPIFSLYDSTGVGASVSGIATINDNNWYLLTGTYEESSGYLRLYLDGALLAETTIPYTGSFKTTEELTMGALDIPNGLDFYYTGYLDEVALFREALDPTEINSLYLKGLGGIDYCEDLIVPSITSTAVTSIYQFDNYIYLVEATGNPVPEFAFIGSPPDGMVIDAGTGEISWTPTVAGSYPVTVVASNVAGSDTQNLTIIVDASSAPIITPIPDTTILQGESFSYTVVATGMPAPEFSLLTQPTGMTIDPVTGIISWTPTVAGNFPVTVEASNLADTDTQEFTIAVQGVFAPVITSISDTSILESEAYAYTAVATGNPAPVFALTQSPLGMTIDSVSGEIAWTSPEIGSYDIIVEATNTEGSDAEEFTLVVQALIAPEITSIAVISILQFEEYSYTVEAIGNPAPEFTLLTFPEGMTIDPVTGVILWTPATSGPFNVSVEARNIVNFDVQDFTIIVDELILPTITSIPELRIMVDEPYSYTVVAEGFPIPELSLEESPSGMSLNITTGELTWTPTVPGTYDVSIEATNVGDTYIQDFTLVVLEPCMDDLISYFNFPEGSGLETGDNANPRSIDITGRANWVSGRVGSALSFNGTSNYLSFPDDPDFDWSASQDFTVEVWCRIDAEKSGLQVFMGRQTSSGTHWWIGMDASKKAAFYLYDQSGAGGGITGLSAINDGAWHHIAAVHRGAEEQNLLYVDGQLNRDTIINYNAGFSSAADIQIANFYTGGTHNYLFRGSLDEIAVSNREIDKNEINEHYLKGLGYEGYCDSYSLSPTIISEPVTNVMVNTPYLYTVFANGVPTPSYSFSGSPPAGMSINSSTGEISWTPTTSGNFNVIVRASNSAGSTTQEFSIRVIEICMSDLISYLRFSEGSGLVTVDEASARILDINENANWAAGVAGNALSFDGTSQYLSFPDDDAFDWSAGQDFSIELWCKVAGNQNHLQVLFGRETPLSTHWWVGINDSKQVAFYLYDEAGEGGGLTGLDPINDGQWHHITAVHDGSLNQNRLFVDGKFNAETSYAYTSGFSSNADLQIANFYSQFWFQGSIDEIAVLNRLLPEDEIYEHYFKGLNGVDYCTDFTLAPSIISAPDTLAVINSIYSYTCEAVGLPVPEYSLSAPPTGMSINATSGEITWTPLIAGSYNVTVNASSSAGSASQVYSILVLETCMENLISYLRFSEGAGSVSEDDANPRTIAIDGNVSWTSGKVGSGVAFDGISQGLSFSDHPDFDWSATQDFSIELWCRSTADNDELQVMFGRETPDETHWWIGMNTEKKAVFYLYDQAHIGGGMVGLSSIDDGNWHHIAAVHLGAQGLNRLYVDGELNAETSFSYTSGFNSSADINIGNFYSDEQNNYFYTGELDEIAVLNRALPEYEIYAHYFKGLNSIDYCQDYSASPIILSDPDSMAMINLMYSYKVESLGLPKPEYELTEAPTGMSIDQYTGVITWIPESSGSFNVIVQASNTVGNTFQNYTLSVFEPCLEELISFMRFNEGQGPVSIDEANLQIIQIEGKAEWGIGKVGNGLSFDGIAQGLSLEANPKFNWTKNQDFTLELWFKTNTSKEQLQVLMGRDVPGSTHWWIGLNDAYQAAFYLYDESRTGGGILGINPLNDNNWHHLTAVHDGSIGGISLYVDGKLNSESTYSYTKGFQADVKIQIANLLNDGANKFFFDGLVDEIAVSNRKLSAQEIFEHYLRGVNDASYCDSLVLIPTISSEPVVKAFVQNSYVYDVEAIGLPAPEFKLINPPTGMTINAQSGLIEWMPSRTGIFEIHVGAVNSGGEDTQTFSLEVFEACVGAAVSYFNFEETGGINVNDQLSDRKGTLINTPVRQEAKIGNSIRFNGTNQYIVIPDDNAFDFPLGSSFTFELWCKPTVDNSNLQVFLGRDETDGIHWWFGLEANSKLPTLYIYDELRDGKGLVGSSPINDGNWHYLVAINNHDKHELSLYIDGVLNTQTEGTYYAGFAASSSIQIASLLRDGEYKFFYDGELDEMVIYNRAITSNEIALHYELGNLGLGYCFSNSLAIDKPNSTISFDYTVYPMPAQEKFFIDLKSPLTSSIRVQLFNTLGVLVYESAERGEELIDVDVSKFAKGLYMLRIINDDKLLGQQSVVISSN